jgi:murein DD-endopeptidase MepM/ murein hydrolase activator NlpD
MRRVAVVAALAAAALLQGCGREPVQTRVVPPRQSLPDDAQLRPGPSAIAPAKPAGEASVAPAEPAPPVAGPLPSVRDPGDTQGAQVLAQRPLLVPVVGIEPGRLADNYEQSRGARQHEALDIMAPHGTPVVAVDDGRITKLFTSKPGGLTIYQYDPSGQLAYYYAHLQGYAQGLREGQEVKRGEVIGYVGVTGNANPNAPHLHFGVFRLGTPPKWWQGEPVNPYPALSRATPAPTQVAAR